MCKITALVYSFKYLLFIQYILFKMYHVVFWDQYCQIVLDCWVNLCALKLTYPLSKNNITNAANKKINPGND